MAGWRTGFRQEVLAVPYGTRDWSNNGEVLMEVQELIIEDEHGPQDWEKGYGPDGQLVWS
jgi:hypothetical protein